MLDPCDVASLDGIFTVPRYPQAMALLHEMMHITYIAGTIRNINDYAYVAYGGLVLRSKNDFLKSSLTEQEIKQQPTLNADSYVSLAA